MSCETDVGFKHVYDWFMFKHTHIYNADNPPFLLISLIILSDSSLFMCSFLEIDNSYNFSTFKVYSLIIAYAR